MPDFAPSATPRYIARYVSGGVGHSMEMRGHRGESQTATVNRATTAMRFFVAALTGVLPDDFTFLSAVYIPQDTNLTTPEGIPASTPGAIPIGSLSPEDKARFLGFAGRGTGPGASKVSIKLFGVSFSTDESGPAIGKDFVVTALESSAVQDAILALNTGAVYAVDDTVAVWYQRATLKVHDFWLRQIRRGIVS